jgi:hypothetical protein
MMVSWIAARLLNQATHATTLSKSMLAAAIVGAGWIYLTAVSHVRGAVAPIEQICGTEVVKTIAPASVETAHRAAGASSAHASSLPFSGTRFRFGFLEFEDAPAE